MNSLNLNQYVDSSSILEDTIAAMVAWQGLTWSENPFSSAYVSLKAMQPNGVYPDFEKSNRRN